MGWSLPISALPPRKRWTRAVAIEAQGHGLPHALVVEGLLRHVHRQLAVLGTVAGHDLDGRIVQERPDVERVGDLHHVRSTALHGDDDRLRRLVEVERQAIEIGPALVPVGLVAHELGRLLRPVAGHAEGPGADRLFREIPGIVGRQDDRLVDLRVVREVADRAGELEAHPVLAGDADAVLLQERQIGLGLRGDLGVDQALEARHHVVRGEIAPVVELDPTADLEEPRVPGVRGRPGCCQDRTQAEVRLDPHQVLGRLLDDGDGPGGVHLDGVDGGRRTAGYPDGAAAPGLGRTRHAAAGDRDRGARGTGGQHVPPPPTGYARLIHTFSSGLSKFVAFPWAGFAATIHRATFMPTEGCGRRHLVRPHP